MELIPIDTHISAIDHGLLGLPGVGACYVVQGDAVALVESGTSLTVEATLAGLARLGVAPEAVEHILLTHVHMDHAGGAGYLAAALPRARVYIHSASAPHLSDPSRLIPSVRRAVGEAIWPLHGAILPIAPERLSAAEHLRLDLGRDVIIEALPTPGHSPDHISYWDRRSGGLFIGDAAGLCMPRYGLELVVTPPPAYDLVAQQQTIALLRGQHIERIYLTHFGAHKEVAERLARADECLQDLVALVDAALQDPGIDVAALARRWLPYPDEAPAALVAQSWGEMSVAGLLRYERKRRAIP
ncbi:MBL fold metallo-hydrolase [Candidatus Gracilibacteria bacterium]|nr:MBL fold metallo-hydrolase [Candidatus Gracilibacteria bacterium]